MPGISPQDFLRRCAGKLLITKKPSSFALNTLMKAPSNLLYSERLDWCRKNWGTETDIIGEPAISIDGQVVVLFNTLGDPPDQWVYNASRLFPNLAFNLFYYKPVEDIVGALICMNAEVIEEVSTDSIKNRDLYESILQEFEERRERNEC